MPWPGTRGARSAASSALVLCRRLEAVLRACPPRWDDAPGGPESGRRSREGLTSRSDETSPSASVEAAGAPVIDSSSPVGRAGPSPSGARWSHTIPTPAAASVQATSAPGAPSANARQIGGAEPRGARSASRIAPMGIRRAKAAASRATARAKVAALDGLVESQWPDAGTASPSPTAIAAAAAATAGWPTRGTSGSDGSTRVLSPKARRSRPRPATPAVPTSPSRSGSCASMSPAWTAATLPVPTSVTASATRTTPSAARPAPATRGSQARVRKAGASQKRARPRRANLRPITVSAATRPTAPTVIRDAIDARDR